MNKFDVLCCVILILLGLHYFSKPDFNASLEITTLWFQQYWVFQICLLLVFIAGTFYDLLKKDDL